MRPGARPCVRKVRYLLFGLGFSLANCLLAFLWFYFIQPMRRIADEVWAGDRSEQRNWVELQKVIRRAGFSRAHAWLNSVGRWGGKAWVNRIMEAVAAEEEI